MVKRFEESLIAGCDREDFRVIHYSLVGNHAHFIVEAGGPEALGRGMKSLTRRLMLAVNHVFGRKGPCWRIGITYGCSGRRSRCGGRWRTCS